VLARTSVLFWLASCVLIASLVLGGGTRGGFLSDTVLQLIAIPLLLVVLWRAPELLSAKQTRAPFLFALALAAIPLLQLVPLPPEVWTALPNREFTVESNALIGREHAWMPISMSPNATWVSALSLMPPISLFLAMLLLSYGERRHLSLLLLVVGVPAVFIGLTQVAQGPASALRFFAVTHPHDATGFFASRNHFAAFLYSLTLFAAAWTVDVSFAAGGRPAFKKYTAPSSALIIAAFAGLVVLVAAQAMARSRAGLALTIAALVGAFALALSDRRSAAKATPAKLLLGVTMLAVMFAVQFTLFRVLERFTEDPLANSRISFARTTIEAAKAYFPIGSGVGTFVPVYTTFERPADAFVHFYVNHAHNDFLEMWLESGVAGLVLLGLFLFWLVRRSAEIWRRPLPDGREIDRMLAKAAMVVIALLLAHSLVDYPLRTGAMMAIFAFACALLIKPSPYAAVAPEGATTRKGMKPPREAQLLPLGTPSGPLPAADAPSRNAGERWGEDTEWPEEWRKPRER